MTLDRIRSKRIFFMARSAFMQGRLERAAELFERASEIRPDDYSGLSVNSYYRSLGREKESIEARAQRNHAAERELTLPSRGSRPAHLGIAALIQIGEKERAREWIDRALAIDPDDPLTRYNVACGLHQTGGNRGRARFAGTSDPLLRSGFKGWLKS